MASNDKTPTDQDSQFSFGVREMQQAEIAARLSLAIAPLKAMPQNHGSDPYNTSGSFDRKKNWTRVGKR